MSDIKGSGDIEILVYGFYSKVRKDILIGPVFNSIILESKWVEHIMRMVDFWECNLFFKPTFKKKVHIDVGEAHYERWSNLWYKSVDDLFKGEIAEFAKIRNGKMDKQLLAKVIEQELILKQLHDAGKRG